jgi:hypothetical protein
MKTSLITLAFGALTLLTAAATAAPPSEYLGSRADVRAFCTGEADFLLEGFNYTFCLTPVTDVLCRDDGTCSSTNFDLARAAGYQRQQAAEPVAVL